MQREMGRKRLADGDKQSRNRKSQKSQSSSLISSCSGQSSVNRSDNVYEEQAKRVCKICCETKNDGLFHDRRGGRCADIFCKQCVGSFVRVQITEGAVTHIKCPGIGCNRVMKEKEILDVIGGEENLLTKFQRFKNNRNLESHPGRWCPTPDCQTYVVAKSKVQKWTCILCGNQFDVDALSEKFSRQSILRHTAEFEG
eukprot:251674_1